MSVLAVQALERQLVEILRAKDDRFLGMFTVAQLLSVCVLAVALALLFRRRRAAAPT
jgi:prolipoprotein diacylglyceryltransferase